MSGKIEERLVKSLQDLKEWKPESELEEHDKKIVGATLYFLATGRVRRSTKQSKPRKPCKKCLSFIKLGSGDEICEKCKYAKNWKELGLR